MILEETSSCGRIVSKKNDNTEGRNKEVDTGWFEGKGKRQLKAEKAR